MLLTFSFVQLRVKGETDFGCADVHELVLVVLYTAKLTNDFLQYVVPVAQADIGGVSGNKMVDREYVSQFDVQGRFCAGVKIVELVNVELRFGVRYINY